MENSEEKHAGGRPVKYKTEPELRNAINQYFDHDAMVDLGEYKSFQPTMAGLARSVGLSRQGLLNYSKKEEFFDTIKDARLRVEEALENRLYGNSPTGAIFNLKNNFGWKDKTETDLSSSDGSMTPKATKITNITDPKEAANLYREMMQNDG
jgi:hypothetical protein